MFFNRFCNGNNFAISVLHDNVPHDNNFKTFDNRNTLHYAALRVHMSYNTYFRTKLASIVNRILINGVQYGPVYVVYLYSKDHRHRPKAIVSQDPMKDRFTQKNPRRWESMRKRVYFYYFVFLYFSRYMFFLRQ